MNPEHILYLLDPNYKPPHPSTREGIEALIGDKIALMELAEIIQANLELIDDELAQTIEPGKSMQYGNLRITHAKPRSTFDKAAFEKKYPAEKYPHLYDQKAVPIPAAALRKVISASEYNAFLKASGRGGAITVKHQG
jgi:hypothetical protein